jgi:hypothetical protein
MIRKATKASGRKPTKADQVDAALVADVERKVREEKSLAISKLPRGKLTPDGLADLERKLVQRGLERTEKTIRVPIEAQILGLLQGGGHVPLVGISKRVKGAIKAEIDVVIHRLIQAGQVRVVIRTAVEVLVGAEERVLSAAELTRLGEVALKLVRILKKIKAKGRPRTMLRDDFAALFEGLEERVVQRPTPSRHLVEAALRRLEDPKLKLVRIPDLVRSLAGKLSVAEVHHALSEAADGGAIELRPDGGTEFLKPEDAVLCPLGPRDTVFSKARLLSP